MFSWTSCFIFIGAFFAYSSASNSTGSKTNTTDELGNRFLVWHDVPAPYAGTKCFTKGRSGICVPLGQCPILEQQVRNLIPALLLDFLAVFTDACGLGGGYCCPDLSQSTAEKTTEQLWTWVDDQKKNTKMHTTTEVSNWNRPTKKTTKSWYYKPTQRPTETPSWQTIQQSPKPNRPTGEKKFTHRNRKLLPEDSCGMDLTSKILGGDEAELGEFPWLALLRLRLRKSGTTAFICGGSLISARYVVSAAHCFLNPELPKDSWIDIVRLGEHDTQSNEDCFGNGECSAPVQDIPVENWKVHEQYNPYLPGSYNDIAIARLAKPAKMNAYVAPICLPMDRFMTAKYDGKKFETAGWGKTSNGRLGKTSSVKLKVNVPFVPDKVCAPQYLAREVELRDTQLCAGGEAGKDSCQGDSGGPLMYSHRMDNEFRYVLVGIVSTGPKECGKAGNAAIYTKVGKYVTWILDNMRD